MRSANVPQCRLTRCHISTTAFPL